MPHFFINSFDVSDNLITISDDSNYNHIARSLRAKCGEPLLLIDENFIQYETIIKSISKSQIVASIIKSYKSNRTLDINIYLAQSPLRSDAQSFVVEKATELGVRGIFPILTDNCALNKSVVENKISKWQRVMYEASKQCERADIPKCYDAVNLEELLNSDKFDYVIAFCERIATNKLKDILDENIFKNNSNILIIVGPEGGFSDREFRLFKDSNIHMLTLGDLILKAETAVTVALGNVIYEYNNSRIN